MRQRVNRLQGSDENEGIPLVLVQGFPMDRETWPKQVQAYKASRRIVEPDSDDGGTGDAPVLMKNFAEDLSALLHHQDDTSDISSKNIELDDDATENQQG